MKLTIKNLRKTCLIILFSIVARISNAQTIDYDTNYVLSYYKNLVVTAVSESKANLVYMNFQTPKKVYELNYKTNSLLTYGFCLDYKWLSLEYTTQMPWTELHPERGESKNFGVGFGFSFRKWTFRNFLQVSEGYYLENTNAWQSNYWQNNSPYYVRPDISTSTYYSTLNYIFNHKKFSNAASLWQLERQLKPVGTFVLGASYIYNNFYADSSIVPTIPNVNYPRNQNTYFSLNAIGINFGWQGTLPLFRSKKWFIGTAIIPGFSYQFGKLTVADLGTINKDKLIGYQSEFRSSLGFNGDKWYICASYRAFGNVNAINHSEPLSITNSYTRLYVGYRFNDPQIKHPLVQKFRL